MRLTCKQVKLVINIKIRKKITNWLFQFPMKNFKNLTIISCDEWWRKCHLTSDCSTRLPRARHELSLCCHHIILLLYYLLATCVGKQLIVSFKKMQFILFFFQRIFYTLLTMMIKDNATVLRYFLLRFLWKLSSIFETSRRIYLLSKKKKKQCKIVNKKIKFVTLLSSQIS
jgi:hypothetical protein